MRYIRINNNKWEENGKVYEVVEAKNYSNSTKIDFVLKDETHVWRQTFPANQVEWIDESDVSF